MYILSRIQGIKVLSPTQLLICIDLRYNEIHNCVYYEYNDTTQFTASPVASFV